MLGSVPVSVPHPAGDSAAVQLCVVLTKPVFVLCVVVWLRVGLVGGKKHSDLTLVFRPQRVRALLFPPSPCTKDVLALCAPGVGEHPAQVSVPPGLGHMQCCVGLPWGRWLCRGWCCAWRLQVDSRAEDGKLPADCTFTALGEGLAGQLWCPRGCTVPAGSVLQCHLGETPGPPPGTPAWGQQKYGPVTFSLFEELLYRLEWPGSADPCDGAVTFLSMRELQVPGALASPHSAFQELFLYSVDWEDVSEPTFAPQPLCPVVRIAPCLVWTRSRQGWGCTPHLHLWAWEGRHPAVQMTQQEVERLVHGHAEGLVPRPCVMTLLVTHDTGWAQRGLRAGRVLMGLPRAATVRAGLLGGHVRSRALAT